MESGKRDERIVAAVCAWFAENARPLPWRVMGPPSADDRGWGPLPRDPYLSLVSEFMLQQTQVSRVLEKWPEFLGRFPSLKALAGAPAEAVVAAWSGMGYYRRARNLHAAARAIVKRFAGRVPGDVAALRSLPGVGRYTAGAIASIVFGKAEPIVDGNVARVLLRVEGKELRQVEGVRWAWGRAERLVQGTRSDKSSRSNKGVRSGNRGLIGPAALNEGLMELGAVVCTARSPRCAECPINRWCRARARGLCDRIPAPKERAERTDLFCAAVVVEDGRGRVLLERRGNVGLWAGMWQVPTLERSDRPARRHEIARWLGLDHLKRVERFEHGTTHRRVVFEVWRTRGGRGGEARVFRSRAALAGLAMSNPQRRILLGRGQDDDAGGRDGLIRQPGRSLSGTFEKALTTESQRTLRRCAHSQVPALSVFFVPPVPR